MHHLFHWQYMMHSHWMMHTISCICQMVESTSLGIILISMVIMIIDQNALIGVLVLKVSQI